jgi:alanine racemase
MTIKQVARNTVKPANEKTDCVAVAEIDLDALANNYSTLKEIAQNAETAGIVKADCYGLGMEQVIPVLKDMGCKTWFVANINEGMRLRRLIGDKDTVYVFGGALRGHEKAFDDMSLTPVLNSIKDIENWTSNAGSAAAIHFDTGMNRLGLGKDETEYFLSSGKLLEKTGIKMVMSHFACADDPDNEMTVRQYEDFRAISDHFPSAAKSLANSAGLLSRAEYAFDLVRPGIALYGGNPFATRKIPARHVLNVKAPVLQVREVKKGETVGYGATHVFTENRIVATVAIGYANGLFRSFGSKGCFYWQGYPCPLAGRVSMELTVIDITDLPGKKPRPGDFVEVTGSSQSIDDLASKAQTIGYEVLTGMGNRCRRIYKY